jgi:hypothetical protein
MYSMFTNIKNLFVDASSQELIGHWSGKLAVSVINGPTIKKKWPYCRNNKIDMNRQIVVVAVPFSTEGKNMLIAAKELLEFERPH